MLIIVTGCGYMYVFQKYNILVKWMNALVAMWRKLILDIWEILAALFQFLCSVMVALCFPLIFTKHEVVYISAIKLAYVSILIVIVKAVLSVAGLVGFAFYPLFGLLSDLLPPFSFIAHMFCGSHDVQVSPINEMLTEDIWMSIGRVVVGAPLMIAGFALVCN